MFFGFHGAWLPLISFPLNSFWYPIQKGGAVGANFRPGLGGPEGVTEALGGSQTKRGPQRVTPFEHTCVANLFGTAICFDFITIHNYLYTYNMMYIDLNRWATCTFVAGYPNP